MKLLKDLNQFLDMWTKNLCDQGFVKAALEMEVVHGE